MIGVFLFKIPLAYPGSWIQIGTPIAGEAAGDTSGTVSLSANGKVVAIGAILNDGNGEDSGHVRIYENLSGTWSQVGNDIDGKASNDFSGWSVALSEDGTVVAIGAILNDGNGLDSGHVRVFKNLAGVWTQMGQDIDGEFPDDLAGFAVSLSSDGNIVAVGAIANGGLGILSGHVRVYEMTLDKWSQIGNDIDGEALGDASGSSVSLSSDGSVMAIGAPLNDGIAEDAGHVRVYRNISGTWTQVGEDIEGENKGDASGIVSLSSNGNVLAIGAVSNDEKGVEIGQVRVFQNISGRWTQVGDDIDGEAAGDQSGEGLSLSSDGRVLAIGAALNNGNGVDSGHVRVYRNNSGEWTQMGGDIDGEAIGDSLGSSVSLSRDGRVLVVGAKGNDDNGENSGHVRVFRFDEDATMPPETKTPAPYVFTALNVQPPNTNFKLSPSGQMVMIGEFIYGTNGEPNEIDNFGSIYRMRPDGSEYTILHIFDGSNNGGIRPESGLVVIEGILYGSNGWGGIANNGSVFRINPDGSNFETLYEFSESDGRRAWITVTKDGILYGVIKEAFPAEGNIFKINSDGTGFAKLHEFQDLFAGRPYGNLILVGDILFGTSSDGGDFDRGTIFRVNTDGSDFTTIHEFDGENGSFPGGRLAVMGDTLFGTTLYSDPIFPDPDERDFGTIYRIDFDGSNFFVLHKFSGFDGISPSGGLLRKGNLLLGTTESGIGGAAENEIPNTLYKINIDGTGFETLHVFEIQEPTDSKPMEALYALGEYIFGTTQLGLFRQNGSFFRLDYEGEHLQLGIQLELGVPYLKITGEPGLMAEIEWSPILGVQSNWQTLTSFEVSGIEQVFADTALGETNARFYRGNFEK